MNQSTLTDKQEAFVSAYLSNGFNATKAAISAGYSEKTAYSQGQRLLKNVEIENRIQAHKSELKRKSEVTIEKIVAELQKIGFSNIQDFLSDDNGLKPLSTLKRSKTAAVSSVKIKRRIHTRDGEKFETVETEFKLYNKLDALEKLGRHLGMFVSIRDLLEKMDEQTAEMLLNELQKRLNQ